MGAWGPESFANDDALDWIAELEQAEDTRLLDDTLSIAAHEPDYLEADGASKAVAAAEVVAALAGLPATHLPEEVMTWVRAHRKSFHKNLITLALRSLDRVRRDSELAELWAEGGSPKWQNVAGAVAWWSSPYGEVDSAVLEIIGESRTRAAIMLITNATSRFPDDLRRLGLDGAFDT